MQTMARVEAALNAVAGRVREEYGMEPTALEQLSEQWDTQHVRLEGLMLTDDSRSIRGTILTRNLAYGKSVAVRFTMGAFPLRIASPGIRRTADGERRQPRRSASISTSISGEINALTSTMLVTGRIFPKNSP